MRTTISLPDRLASFIQDALREALGRTKRGKAGSPVRLITHGGSGLQPGGDLDDSAGLLDLMKAGPAADRR